MPMERAPQGAITDAVIATINAIPNVMVGDATDPDCEKPYAVIHTVSGPRYSGPMDNTEIGSTWLGQLIIALQQLLAETEPQVVIGQLQEELPEFLDIRPLLIDLLAFIETKAPEPEVRDAAEVLGGRLKNLRVLGQ